MLRIVLEVQVWVLLAKKCSTLAPLPRSMMELMVNANDPTPTAEVVPSLRPLVLKVPPASVIAALSPRRSLEELLPLSRSMLPLFTVMPMAVIFPVSVTWRVFPLVPFTPPMVA
jgi:hypothetical protein